MMPKAPWTMKTGRNAATNKTTHIIYADGVEVAQIVGPMSLTVAGAFIKAMEAEEKNLIRIAEEHEVMFSNN